MPIVLNNASWRRSCKKLLGGKEYCAEPLQTSPALATITPGWVGVVINGVVKLADKDLDGGAFTGIFFTEKSSTLDEITETGKPVLVTGEGNTVVWIGKEALGGSTSGFTLNATQTVDLVVGDDGVLVTRGELTGPTVAKLLAVDSDGITIHLMSPSV